MQKKVSTVLSRSFSIYEPADHLIPKGKSSLSSAGCKQLNDFCDILDDFCLLVEKNGDESLQEFVWGSRDRNERLMEDRDTEEVKEQSEEEVKARVDKAKAKENANQGMCSCMMLLHPN